MKLDAGILHSSVWVDMATRNVFLTALIMAEPWELKEPQAQLELRGAKGTGWMVPAGWYGFVAAASVGLVHASGVDPAAGMDALKRMGEPEEESRTSRFAGRRLVRVSGGFVVLNYDMYRQKDYTSAERTRRWRDRKRREEQQRAAGVTRTGDGVPRTGTQAEAEADG